MTKILAIDDETEILDLIRIVLEGAGYDVVTCPSGKQAWDLIVKSKADLVILDVMLPGVDGYSLQLQMSQDKVTRHIPVLILTALEPAKTLFEKAGNVIGFLAKPFRAEDLLSKIRAVLESKTLTK